MKKCKFGIVLFLTIFLICVFFARTNNSENSNSLKAEEINVTIEKPNGAKSCWALSFIHINNNWSKTEQDTDWCNGKGTVDEPYIIENVTIKNPTELAYIKIENTNECFVLKNCSVIQSFPSYYSKGIYLNKVNNGTIENCSLTYNFYGIQIDYCKNITISKCYFNLNYFMNLYLNHSNNNIIKNNFENTLISFHSICGICLACSNYNNISYNYIFDNEVGISLYRSNYTYVGHNILVKNDVGIDIIECESNTFEDNYDDSIPPPPPPLPPSVHHGSDSDDTSDLKFEFSDSMEYLIDPITLMFVYPILSALAIIFTKEIKKFLSYR